MSCIKGREVFITKKTNSNFESARKYGKVTFVTLNEMPMEDIANFCSEIVKRMANYKPGDFLIPNGNPIVFAIMFAHAIKLGSVAILKWNNRLFEYTEIEITNGTNETKETTNGS